MKYINVIITVIAVFLFLILVKLVHLGVVGESLNENIQLSLVSERSLIASNHRLENEIAQLREQIRDLASTLLKK